MKILPILAALPVASAFSRLSSASSTFIAPCRTAGLAYSPPLRLLGRLGGTGRPTEEGGPLLDALGTAFAKTPLYESVAATQPLALVGEDAGVFKWTNEKWGALGETGWTTFFAAVSTILTALAVLLTFRVPPANEKLQS